MPERPIAPEPVPEQPVFVPMMAPVMEDIVERRERRRNGIVIAAVALAVLVSGWYGYRRMVDPVAAEQAYTDGVRLYRANRYEQAILNFSRAVDLKPDLGEAYRMRGRSYAALSDPDKAIADFTKVSMLLRSQ